MRAYKSAVFALVGLTLEALPVGAQDAKTVEVTPYVALGSAAASPVGAAVTFPVTSAQCRDRRCISSWRGPHPCVEFKHQSLVFPSARRPIDTVCRHGSWAIAIRSARFLLQRSSDRHRGGRRPDSERWRRREDANE